MSQSVLREAKLSCSDQEGGRDAYFVSLLSDIVSEVQKKMKNNITSVHRGYDVIYRKLRNLYRKTTGLRSQFNHTGGYKVDKKTSCIPAYPP